MLRLIIALSTLAFGLSPATAENNDVQAGKTLAENNCKICHAIEPQGTSPLSEAPPFRDIAASYDQSELEDAFNEGVATEHPAMPDWKMTSDQARQLSAYIMSLAAHGIRKTEMEQ
jgi:cytochrome c